jgi:hypothetical protein
MIKSVFKHNQSCAYILFSLSQNRREPRELLSIPNGPPRYSLGACTANNLQTMDSRLPSLFHHSALGLPYGHIDRQI